MFQPPLKERKSRVRYGRNKQTYEPPYPNISNMGGNLVSKTLGDRVIWGIVVILTLGEPVGIQQHRFTAYKYSKSTESYLFYSLASSCWGAGHLFRSPGELYHLLAGGVDLICGFHLPAYLYTFRLG